MSIRKIKTGADNPALRQKAEEVREITPAIKEVISDILDTIKDKNDITAGLAAPQIGQSVRIIAVRGDTSEKPQILINPRIIKASHRTRSRLESCLSLPNIAVPVKRSTKIVVEALDENGQPVKIKAREFFARCIQHEIEHLDGILIVDKQE